MTDVKTYLLKVNSLMGFMCGLNISAKISAPVFWKEKKKPPFFASVSAKCPDGLLIYPNIAASRSLLQTVIHNDVLNNDTQESVFHAQQFNSR